MQPFEDLIHHVIVECAHFWSTEYKVQNESFVFMNIARKSILRCLFDTEGCAACEDGRHFVICLIFQMTLCRLLIEHRSPVKTGEALV